MLKRGRGGLPTVSARHKGGHMKRRLALFLAGTFLILTFTPWPAVAQAHLIERVSVSSKGGQGNGMSTECSLSGDGRFAAFCSWASNLVTGDTNGKCDIFVRDRQTGTTERVSVASVCRSRSDATSPR